MGFLSRCLSAKCLVLLAIIIEIFVPECLTITTTFHDKPDETKLPMMAKLMRQEEEITTSPPSNSTTPPDSNTTELPTSERQKRLLPYMTFYLAHDFNLAQENSPPGQVYQTPQGTRYQIVQPQQQKPATTYQQFHNKFTELTSNHQPQQAKIKITPFLDGNALPGPFQPMRQVHVQGKVPNFSQIYDKLAQLKLVQQQQHQQAPKAYTRYQPFHYQQQQQQQQKPQQPQFNYIPLIDYQEVGPPQIQDDKTTIHTYSSTNIDIPMPRPPESHHQQFISSPPHHQDHVQPVTDEEHKQYLEDTQKYVHQEIRRPPQILVLRQKPIPAIPHKIVYEDGKPTYQQLPQKQLVYVRKPPQIASASAAKQQPQVIQFVIPQQNKYLQQQQGPSYNNNYDNVVRYETGDKYQGKPTHQEHQHQTYEQVVYQDYQVPKYVQPTSPQLYNPPVLKYQHIPYSTHKPKTQQQPVITYEKIAPPPQHSQQQPGREYHQHHSSPTAVGVTTGTPYLTTENSNSLSVILKKLQDTNALPHTLTPENIDNSIKTLVKILSSLKKKQHHFSRPIIVEDETPNGSVTDTSSQSHQHQSTSGEGHNIEDNEAGVGLGPDVVSQSFPLDTQEGGTPGKPGVDYPALSTIPKTSFSCKTQRYKGFFGDPDTHCQVWHYCDLNGGQASFLCPNGTIFSQVALTCDWWYNVKCSTTTQLYVLNERLYKYILPLSPKFPEDYSGPLVDRYLALKFKEMEEKMKKQRKQNNKEEEQQEEEEKEEAGDSEDVEEENETGKPEGNSETTAKLEVINVEEDKSTENSNSEVTGSEQNEDQV